MAPVPSGGTRYDTIGIAYASLRREEELLVGLAEIKARLDRYREVRKENEARLAKAQDDLRAVLTVKQEAMAVMMGLLP